MNAPKDFSFRELDTEGMETLEAMSVAPGFNRWMYERVCQHLSGRILEIGSGIGNISSCFLEDERSICLSDIRENYCAYLRKTFQGNKSLEGVLKLNLTHPDFDTEYKEHIGSFDGLFALNVVEHIEDDQLAIANANELLRPGGRMVILVPAFQYLYNQFDESLEHYRRYNKQSLSLLFEQNKLQIKKRYYFNLAGVPGWYIYGNLLGRKIIPNGPMKIFNTLVPIFKFADWMFSRWVGLSVVVEAVKPTETPVD